MNKKLLYTSALAGVIAVSGSAFAEMKISGDVTNTVNFGSDDAGTNGNNGRDSNERIGTEFNLKIGAKKDLDNGMYISYKGKLEVDDAQDSASGQADHEYEIQLGMGNFYVGTGSDGGNNISSSPTLPLVGYHPGTLAFNTGSRTPLNYDGLVGASEANDKTHLSLNYKALGGTFSAVYAPNVNEQDDDSDNIDDATGGSRTTFLYQGSPMEGLKFIIGRNSEEGDTSTTTTDEIDTDKIGVSYNFGQFAAGIELQNQEDAATLDNEVINTAVTFAVNDNATIGLTYSEAEKKGTANSKKEEITTLSYGYNLGGASISAAYVDAKNVGASTTSGLDNSGLVITTKFGF